MPDPRFFTTSPPLRLGEAVKVAGGVLSECDPDVLICRVASLNDDDLSGAAVYVENKRAAAQLSDRAFGLCITSDVEHTEGLRGNIVRVENARLGFAMLSNHLHASREFDGQMKGINSNAIVSKHANVHPSAIVGAGAEIGSEAVIGPLAVIGPGVIIGKNSQVSAGAVITHAIIGERSMIFSGARIGQEGFGIVRTKKGVTRVPQLGRVLVGDDIEIGANTTIDRGAIGDTKIGDGTKIDNQVHIGHNVTIGRNCILAGQVGISGSCQIGDRVIMGGKVGLIEHLVIGDDVMIGAAAGVMHDIPSGEKWGGYPARPIRVWLRGTAILNKLSKKTKKVR